MDQCPFCGTRLLANTTFCSNCGRTFDQSAAQATHLTDAPTLHLEGEPDETVNTTPPPVEKTSIPGRITLLPLGNDAESAPPENDEEDEEEKRRKAALAGLGAPLLGELINQPAQAQTPVLQGTPQASNVPIMHGTPQGAAGSPTLPAPGTGAPSAQSTLLKRLLPTRKPGHHKPPRHHRPPRHHHHHHHHRIHHFLHATHGGISNLVIMIGAATALILGGIFTLGATAFSPNLSLSGGSTIQSGGNLTIHGGHFIPNSNVELTLDNKPLYISGRVQPAEQASTQRQAGTTLNMLTSYTWLQPGRSNVISVRGDGTFLVTIYVDPSWVVGKHTIHASEAVTHRSASLSFTVAAPSVTVTETPTATPTPTPTPSPTPSPTPTPTPAPAPFQPPSQTPPPPALSCATPGTLNLGPVTAGSSRTVSGTVTLCTTGVGLLNWSSSHSSASWLRVNPGNGSIHAPSIAHVTVSASAAHLAAGTYTSTITFGGGVTQTVHVTFTVKAPVPGLLVSPTSLDEANSSQCSVNPEGQSSDCTVTVTNTSSAVSLNWSASGSANATIQPGSGTLAAGGSARVAISVPLSNCDGSAHTVATFKGPGNSASVTWTCAAPKLSVSPTSLDANNTDQCSYNTESQLSNCTVTVTNTSSVAGLNWSASGDVGATVSPQSGTLGPGSSARVAISVPLSNCIIDSLHVATFKGPANSVGVIWACPAPQLSVNTTSLNGNNTDQCSFNEGSQVFSCTVTLTNDSRFVDLAWSASGGAGATVSPQSSTLGPGSSISVTIVVPFSDCNGSTITVATFKGPANSIDVTFSGCGG